MQRYRGNPKCFKWKIQGTEKCSEYATFYPLLIIFNHYKRRGYKGAFVFIKFLKRNYEGIDQRVIDEIKPEEISIGDYVLTGGEIPAMALIDSVSRYVDGVLNEDSTSEESFSAGLLEYPQYTRPEVFNKRVVPDVLKSGHHENIRKWRRAESIKNTYNKRPELLENVNLSEEDKKVLKDKN